MSDELNVWREADAAQCLAAVNAEDGAEQAAAAVIRDYGDRRDATARSEGHAAGYQQAIADVVEWLRSGDAFALTDHETADEITRRFGKDA